jgi:hypothetical protein
MTDGTGEPARKLSVHQQAVLVQVLLAFPEQRVAVQYLPSAGDSCSYADDFLNIFKAVGWTVYDSAPVVGSLRPRSGLGIVVGEGYDVPAGAEALRDALRIYGVEVETVWDPTGCVGAGDFVLVVG